MPCDLCSHVKKNGLVCQSPALKGSAFCYHHFRLTKQKSSIVAFTQREVLTASTARTYDLPPLIIKIDPIEDARSLNLAVSQVLVALASNRLAADRATAILYGLQLAANNLRHF